MYHICTQIGTCRDNHWPVVHPVANTEAEKRLANGMEFQYGENIVTIDEMTRMCETASLEAAALF